MDCRRVLGGRRSELQPSRFSEAQAATSAFCGKRAGILRTGGRELTQRCPAASIGTAEEDRAGVARPPPFSLCASQLALELVPIPGQSRASSPPRHFLGFRHHEHAHQKKESRSDQQKGEAPRRVIDSPHGSPLDSQSSNSHLPLFPITFLGTDLSPGNQIVESKFPIRQALPLAWSPHDSFRSADAGIEVGVALSGGRG
jgi:hypothetical protein